VYIPDLVIIKYFGNNTIEIKRLVLTFPDLIVVDPGMSLWMTPIAEHFLMHDSDFALHCTGRLHPDAKEFGRLRDVFCKAGN